MSDPYGDPTRADTPVTDPTMAMPATAGAQPPAGPRPGGVPPSEPPDRRPWIIVALLLLIVAAGLLVLLLQDDHETASSDSSTTSSTVEDTTTSTSTTTTSSTTSTTAPTTTSPPVTVAPGLCASSDPDEPEPTAQVVYQAYTVGDRDCAAKLATPDAVDELFAIPGGGGGWSFAGCFDQEDPDPHTQCSFTFEGGSTGFNMSYSDTDGWIIYEVFQVAD
jgi:hypothetical protein